MVIILTDGYEAYYEEYLDIDSDQPTIEFVNLPTTLYDAYNYKYFDVKVRLKNGYNETVENQPIYWYQNYGDSLTGNEWDEAELGLKTYTNENGVATQRFPARAGVKLIKATTGEDVEGYEYLEITSYINYDIDNIYIGGNDVTQEIYFDNITEQRIFKDSYKVENGEVIIPLANNTPPGLYDIKIEYINNSQSQCKTYSNSEKTYGVARKIGVHFDIDNTSKWYNSEKNRYEEEVTKQLEISAKTKDEYGNVMTEKAINIDYGERSKKQKTDNNGKVIHHYVTEIPDMETSHTFSYPQNRTYAKSSKSVKSYSKPLKPYFSIIKDNIDYMNEDGLYKKWDGTAVTKITQDDHEGIANMMGYIGNEMELAVRAYYYKKEYAITGEEIRLPTTGEGKVYWDYDEEGNSIYYLENGSEKTTVDKQYYKSSTSSNKIVHCTETPMQFTDDNISTNYPNIFKINDLSKWIIDRKSATDEGYTEYANSEPKVTDGGLNLGQRYDCVYDYVLDMSGTKEYVITLRLVNRFTRIGLRRTYNGEEIQTFFDLNKQWTNTHYPRRRTMTFKLFYDIGRKAIRLSSENKVGTLINGNGGTDYKIYLYSISNEKDSEVVGIEERTL